MFEGTLSLYCAAAVTCFEDRVSLFDPIFSLRWPRRWGGWLDLGRFTRPRPPSSSSPSPCSFAVRSAQSFARFDLVFLKVPTSGDWPGGYAHGSVFPSRRSVGPVDSRRREFPDTISSRRLRWASSCGGSTVGWGAVKARDPARPSTWWRAPSGCYDQGVRGSSSRPIKLLVVTIPNKALEVVGGPRHGGRAHYGS
jgi:hypothetical protein